MAKEKIKIECEKCKAKGTINRPFGMNKYLCKMTYSACEKCCKEKKK